MVAIRIYLPPELRAKFKAWCAIHDTNMNEQIQEMIESLVQANGKEMS